MVSDRDTKKMRTYIIETVFGEFYCGKTNNIEKRMKEHKEAKNGKWFKFKNRKEFEIKLIIDNDYEKEIKRFGIKKFYNMFKMEVFYKIYMNNLSEVSLS